MTEPQDEWIKKRAYAIWEEEGYPQGRDTAHWEQASGEHAAMKRTAPTGVDVKPKVKRKTAAAAANGSATRSATKTASRSKNAAPKI